jgi:hypothetical protein
MIGKSNGGKSALMITPSRACELPYHLVDSSQSERGQQSERAVES